jgi:hypothetical protein
MIVRLGRAREGASESAQMVLSVVVVEESAMLEHRGVGRVSAFRNQ